MRRFNDYPVREYPSMPRCDSTESKGKYSQWRNPLNDIVCASWKQEEWSMGDAMETWQVSAAPVEQNHGHKVILRLKSNLHYTVVVVY